MYNDAIKEQNTKNTLDRHKKREDEKKWFNDNQAQIEKRYGDYTNRVNEYRKNKFDNYFEDLKTQMQEQTEKKEKTRSFAKYVSPELVQSFDATPLMPTVDQRSNLTVKMRNMIDKGQNFNREGIQKDLASSGDIYNEIKSRYNNHYSRYNIITGL